MPRAAANGIEIEYETIGDPGDPPLLLVMGLGAQMGSWDPDLCRGLVDRGFFVIRFDNRDVGLSTKIDTDVDAMGLLVASFLGQEADTDVEPPFLLVDMAADAFGLLDALGIDAAHIVGASMGGMIVQTMAITHPERVLSMTSIMSTTGDPDVGQPNPEILGLLLEAAPSEREAYIEHAVAGSRAIGSPEHFEEDRARAKAALAFDRCFYPAGTAHQLLAIVASPSRSEDLKKLEINTLVIHGDADPLVNMTGGQRTAEVIPGADLMILEGMGHDMPSVYWPTVIEAITALAVRSSVDA